ncbi:MAG: tetratricopeptide repeat protein [Bacteroidetes bacterium]|nr:tetratricopeptide repeat protein [Bacteroidota bacterium]MBS1932912.1 tetratricopeptide repeat protein [Bacteroidota bacterium]
MRLFFITILLTAYFPALALTDTSAIRSLYARCMNFSEDKIDSLDYYANFIAKESSTLNYSPGKLYSLRLHGLCEEYKGDYDKAINYYLQCLETAHQQKNAELEIAELTDLAIVYTEVKRFVEAKNVYLQCINMKSKNDTSSLLDSYINLGAIYNNLNLHDSALFFLQKGLALSKSFHREGNDLSSLYNNLGNTYFFKKEYSMALSYFEINRKRHLTPDKKADLWVDYLNIADVYIEESNFNLAKKYADSSMQIADFLQSRSKQADNYSLYAKLYQHKNDYKKANDYLLKWYNLDTAMVNNETNETIARLQEQYHARQRENEKLVLQAAVDKAIFRSRMIMIVACALLVIALIIALALITKRRANKKLQDTNALIIEQNEKLAELNFEKNALISIVSHDLSTPFATIGMWSQLLRNDEANLTGEQKKSIRKIEEATLYGEKLIRRILQVEKSQTNQQKINLEKIELNSLVRSVGENFRPMAENKDIKLHINTASSAIDVICDKELVTRICENLLSNAVKFTQREKNIWVSVEEENGSAKIIVKDEGVGIEKDELPQLFLKYSKISSQSTEGEPSTGLGLAIVKRLVEELNGSIYCDSEPGFGSTFTVVLKK